MPKQNFIKFKRELLPPSGRYYREQGLKLKGGSEWKSALCPFHDDSTPSLRIRLDSGCFRCMVCSAKGGDVLAFHMKLHKLNFLQAVRELHAF